jgi:hypothetical protein
MHESCTDLFRGHGRLIWLEAQVLKQRGCRHGGARGGRQPAGRAVLPQLGQLDRPSSVLRRLFAGLWPRGKASGRRGRAARAKSLPLALLCPTVVISQLAGAVIEGRQHVRLWPWGGGLQLAAWGRSGPGVANRAGRRKGQSVPSFSRPHSACSDPLVTQAGEPAQVSSTRARRKDRRIACEPARSGGARSGGAVLAPSR